MCFGDPTGDDAMAGFIAAAKGGGRMDSTPRTAGDRLPFLILRKD